MLREYPVFDFPLWIYILNALFNMKPLLTLFLPSALLVYANILLTLQLKLPPLGNFS